MIIAALERLVDQYDADIFISTARNTLVKGCFLSILRLYPVEEWLLR